MKFLGIIFLASQLVGATLVPGTNDTWTDGVDTWRGNPFCKQAGMILSPDSPAIGAADDGGDIGACSAFLVNASAPPAPGTLEIQ